LVCSSNAQRYLESFPEYDEDFDYNENFENESDSSNTLIFGAIGDAVGRGVSRAYDKTKEGVTKAYDKTKEGVGKAYDKTKEGVTKAYDKGKAGAQVIGKNIKEAISEKPAAMGKRIVFGLKHANWMKQFWPVIANMRIKDLCVAGTHDAGTAQLTSPSPDLMQQDWKSKALASKIGAPITDTFIKRWSQTQDLSIYDQLVLGVRYMDLRFCRKGSNDFAICHGLYGYSAATVFSELTNFLHNNPYEVVMIQIRPFDSQAWVQSDYNKFFSIVNRNTKGGSIINSNWNGDSTLNSIVKSGKRLLITHNKKKSNINYNQVPGLDFNKIDDYWANKQTPKQLREDLNNYVHKALRSGITQTYIRNLQYLLTPDTEIIVKGYTYRSYAANLHELTRVINYDLDSFISDEIVKFTNILMVDFAEETRAVDIAIAITLLRAGHQVPKLYSKQNGNHQKVLTLSTQQLGEIKRYSSLVVPRDWSVVIIYANGRKVSYNTGNYRLDMNTDIVGAVVNWRGAQMQ